MDFSSSNLKLQHLFAKLEVGLFSHFLYNFRALLVKIESVSNASIIAFSYNRITVKGAAASRVFFHLRAEAVRMRE